MKFLLTTTAILLLAVTANAQTRRARGGDNGIMDHVRKQHRPFDESLRVNSRGRQDTVFQTRSNWDTTFNYYRNAYRNGTTLSGGVTVKGWYVFPEKRRATFTLYRGAAKAMLVMDDSPDGAVFTMYGRRFVRPRAARQRPYHRGYPRAHTVQYGL